ncbi:MAG: nickel pincer cofactor biosynthesis protein LarB [Coriobacteriales bacterium]|jgi:NCAIR mutase (PurE)-related protein|nr:nickel pincer cofactor biosynthesis protein LarB [Coriobacteriales bacterium]
MNSIDDYANLDFDREQRCGFPEVIYGAGKTAEQVAGIMSALVEHHDVALCTRASTEQATATWLVVPDAHYIASCGILYADRRPEPLRMTGSTVGDALGVYDPGLPGGTPRPATGEVANAAAKVDTVAAADVADTADVAGVAGAAAGAAGAAAGVAGAAAVTDTAGAGENAEAASDDVANDVADAITNATSPVEAKRVQNTIATPDGLVVVCCAGTSDLAVAEEAALTARIMGSRVVLLHDVGIAGVHRVLAHEHELRAARVVVAVAGMEGALPSLVAGLVDVPVIAVPTSVGYGASFGGIAALLGMLNSCAGGVSVVNIDNGFGAGVIAHRINLPAVR